MAQFMWVRLLGVSTALFSLWGFRLHSGYRDYPVALSTTSTMPLDNREAVDSGSDHVVARAAVGGGGLFDVLNVL
jgi:hypothetical protein